MWFNLVCCNQLVVNWAVATLLTSSEDITTETLPTDESHKPQTDDSKDAFNSEVPLEIEHEVTAKLDDTCLFTYHIAKKSPLLHISISHLAAEYGATEFIPALKIFLKDHMPTNSLKPSTFDQFDLFYSSSIKATCQWFKTNALQSMQHLNTPMACENHLPMPNLTLHLSSMI